MKRNELVRQIEKESRNENNENRALFILKCLRVLIHFLLAVVVLGAAAISKIILLLITNELNHFEKVCFF